MWNVYGQVFFVVELPWLLECVRLAVYIIIKQSHSQHQLYKKKIMVSTKQARAILPSSPVLIRSAAERDVWFSYCIWKMCQFPTVHKEISSKSTNSSRLLNQEVYKLCLWVRFVFRGVVKWVSSKLCPPHRHHDTYPDISYVFCVFRWT